MLDAYPAGTRTMPIRKSGNFDLNADVVRLTQMNLAGFLNQTELVQTEVKLEGGRISFVAPEPVDEKIAQHFGQPAGTQSVVQSSSTIEKQKAP